MQKNSNKILIIGPPDAGKTFSLKYLNQDKLLVINTDGQFFPYQSDCAFYAIPHVSKFPKILQKACKSKYKYICIDSLTHLMTSFENQYVIKATNTQKGWGDYQTFFMDILETVKQHPNKIFIFVAHINDINKHDEDESPDFRVPIKGHIGKVGVESFFSPVLTSINLPTKKVKKFKKKFGKKNKLLKITPIEEAMGVKRVFLTNPYKKHPGMVARGADGLWVIPDELYIDNNMKYVIDRLIEFTKENK